ncbi:WYL domain-containing protein [Candidatus Pacearchaeota archaeon]|nr:WYL domain-containing protein [Candidatus Pacearchaeota archaeon]
MVSLTKTEKQKLKRILSKSKYKDAKDILRKMNNEKRLKYAYDRKDIISLLRKAYKEKKKVKIRYYSLSSDEVKWRIVDIYKLDSEFVIAFCHLRQEERTFVINRINQAAILDESYKVPKDWISESRV